MLFVGGLVCLIVGAEALVRGASRLAVAVGITPLVVGITVVAYGTSAPEVAVSVQAVFAQPPQSELAIGNVVGSNISNVLIVLGLSSLAAPLVVSRTLVRITVPIMLAVTMIVWLMCLNGSLDRWEGMALVLGAVIFTVVSVARSRRATVAALAIKRQPSAEAAISRRPAAMVVNLIAILIGLALLVLGARWLVEGATAVARWLQVSELVVGLTVVAVGTSLPEIATSLVASIRGQRDIAVGNVVGSNIFNLLLVLGVCALVSPQPVAIPASALRFDFPIMFLVSVACWPVFYTQWTISRWEGGVFLSCYVAYTILLYLQATQSGGLNSYIGVMAYGVIPLVAIALTLLSLRHFFQENAAAARSEQLNLHR